MLLTGKVWTDVRDLLDEFGFGDARELIGQKRRGELAELPEPMIDRWRDRVQRAFTVLDEALGRSALPEEPRNIAALDDWLLRIRQRDLDVRSPTYGAPFRL